MTLREIRGFSPEVAKILAHEQIQLITSVAIGAQGDSKGIKKTIESLEEAIKKAG